MKLRDLTGRLDHISRQRDGLRDDNDHLLREMALAGSEIHQLQSQIHDLERDLECAQVASVAADASLDRLRDELRLPQEEVVTNDYVGSAYGGSTLGSARGGSPAPDTSSSSPYAVLVRLSACDELRDKLTDTELQRDKAATEWAVATRTQTELKSKIRRMSDKLKDAEKTSAQLRDQVAIVRNQHKQLVLKHDRSLSERDIARQRLTLVAIAISDPLPAQAGSPPAVNTSASRQSLEVDDDGGADDLGYATPGGSNPTGSKTKVVRHPGSSKPGPTASSSTKDSAKAGSAAKSSSKVKSKIRAAAKVASKVGSRVKTSSKTVSVAVVPTKSGSKTGSATKPSSKTTLFPTGSAAVAPYKSGSASKDGSVAKTSTKTGSSTGSAATAFSTTGLVASTAGSVSTQSGSTAGSFVAVSTVSRPASSGSQLVGSGSGKARVKRPIPTGCELRSSEDDEDDGSDWSDGSGPPIRSSSSRTLSAGHFSLSSDDDDDDDEDSEDSGEARVADDV
ncbi:hypothetical protein PInf_002578 [Phytophthora infestans]|nr:hypothetical protein PInf_002578 [Phytophthora infestans]